MYVQIKHDKFPRFSILHTGNFYALCIINCMRHLLVLRGKNHFLFLWLVVNYSLIFISWCLVRLDPKTRDVVLLVLIQDYVYQLLPAQLEELRGEDQQIREAFSVEIEELQRRCQEKQEDVDFHRGKFVEFKHQVALNAINSRSGKPIQPKVR